MVTDCLYGGLLQLPLLRVDCFTTKHSKTLKKYERDFAKEIEELSAERKKIVIENSKIASQVLSSSSKTI